MFMRWNAYNFYSWCLISRRISVAFTWNENEINVFRFEYQRYFVLRKGQYLVWFWLETGNRSMLWISDDPVHWRIQVLLGLSELFVFSKLCEMYCTHSFPFCWLVLTFCIYFLWFDIISQIDRVIWPNVNNEPRWNSKPHKMLILYSTKFTLGIHLWFESLLEVNNTKQHVDNGSLDRWGVWQSRNQGFCVNL